MADSRIRVDGLKELQTALRQADKDFPKELRLANKEAAEVVAAATRSSFATRPGVAPKVAASVKALAQQRNASVKIGGNAYPYAMGSNFGSIRFKQFPPVKRPDYSLYSSIADKRDETVEVYGEAVDRLMRKAFPR